MDIESERVGDDNTIEFEETCTVIKLENEPSLARDTCTPSKLGGN